jgi:hypothetical protein
MTKDFTNKFILEIYFRFLDLVTKSTLKVGWNQI